MNKTETSTFINSIKYIINDLGEELSTRTGFSSDEYQSIINKITGSDNNVLFTNEEIIMLDQSLNEVCNGVVIPDFDHQIGMPLFEVKKMLELLNHTLGEV